MAVSLWLPCSVRSRREESLAMARSARASPSSVRMTSACASRTVPNSAPTASQSEAFSSDTSTSTGMFTSPSAWIVAKWPAFRPKTSALALEHSASRELLLPIGLAGNAAVLLGFALPICLCIELIWLLCDRKTRYRIWADELDIEAETHLFLGAFGCILLLWLPILFLCYPGSVHGDTRVQIMSWLGLRPITSAYPVFTTAVYGTLYKAGAAMGGQAKALFLNVMVQALFAAAAMGLTAEYICRYTRSKRWFWLAVVFFGV